MEYVEPALALTLACLFFVTGALRMRPAPSGKRAIGPSTASKVVARVRGVGEMLAALAVAAGIRFPDVGLGGGVALAALGLWSAVEAARPPIRWGRLVLAAVGFLLAVFYLGFRD